MSAEKEKRLSGEKDVQLAQTVMKCALFAQRDLNQVCQQFGLNINQFCVLSEIVSKGPLSQKRLCERLLSEKSNISKIVKTLLSKNLVTAVGAPEDRRLTLLIETQEGVERQKACMQNFSTACADLFSSLKDEEVVNIVMRLELLEYEFRSRVRRW